MTSLSKVVDQMQGNGLPALPAGHPILDGKVHRFGPKKKAWYTLREIDLKSGARIIGGAFGVWQGDNNNAVTVAIDWQGVSPEERAAAEAKQREHDAREKEKRAQLAVYAANRAAQQWKSASEEGESPYLARKKVAAENVRFTEDGTLLVPLKRYARDSIKLVGLQKILADGTKLFNKGMDKIGVACLLGPLNDQTKLVIVVEGYATAGSIRLATDYEYPVMVGIDAGNLMPVVMGIRRDFPDLHILIAADDDFLLMHRFAERLREDFHVSVPVEVNGIEQRVKADDGSVVSITATWREDGCGIRYIDTDIRAGRQMRSPKFENAGLARAAAAAKAAGNASVVQPVFKDRGLNKWTDFNDLHVEQSIDDVRIQILDAVGKALATTGVELPPAPALSLAHSDDSVPRSPSNDNAAPVMEVKAGTIESLLKHFSLVYGKTDVWDSLNQQVIKKAAFAACFGAKLAKEWLEHPDRKTKDQRDLPALKGGRAIQSGGGGGDPLVELHERYVLLYGTETVWDRKVRDVVSLSALRAAYPDLAGRWLDSPHREMREAKNLVFDPTMQSSPDTHINMFGGFPLIPKQDDALVEPVLDLLASLCSSERNHDEVFDWLLKWLAYPLQYPGAKMQTAILMFGEKQGTGKSLFFEKIMRPIYGDYGTTAGQHQLESSFTDWKSRKIFVLFEEVLSRDQRYSHLGTLKHMITGTDQRINPKNLPERVEQNHLNAVFLSNEAQPIPIDLEDRRFLVVGARSKLDKSFYSGFKGLLKRGASAAFYEFLLRYPLGDFNEHTKPVDTDTKDSIIKFGLPGWHVFHERWRDGEIPAPYCSCITEDLYTVYSRWCEKAHEKRLSLTKFSELMSGRVGKTRLWITLAADSAKRMRTVFIVDDDDKATPSAKCQKFRDLADIK